MQEVGDLMAATKAKIIHIAEILQKTDEYSPLTAVEIGRRLEQEYGIMAERKSICRDIRVLRDECGMDILLSADNKKGYFLATHTFEDWELKLLMDAVLDMRFLPKKDSLRLLKKLREQASNQSDKMLREITPYMGRSEKWNTGVKRVIDSIISAIKRNHQLIFQYQDRQPDTVMKLRKNGALYRVNPYMLVFRNNFYYLVGNYDKYKNLGFYRLDRIGKIMETSSVRKSLVDLLGRDAVKKLVEFIQTSIYSFIGDELEIKIALPDYMVNDIMDSFDENHLRLYKIPNGQGGIYSYEAHIKTINSEGLYYWLLQRADHIKVLTPEIVKQELIRKIKAMLEIYGCDINDNR